MGSCECGLRLGRACSGHRGRRSVPGQALMVPLVLLEAVCAVNAQGWSRPAQATTLAPEALPLLSFGTESAEKDKKGRSKDWRRHVGLETS